MKIAVDPGHGDINKSLGGDGGAVGYLIEQECNLKVSNFVVEKLKNLGYEVYNVRPMKSKSVRESLFLRCEKAKDANMLISIHFNAGGGVGTEVYAMSKEGYKLANSVLSEIVASGFRNRGLKDGSGFYVIKNSKPIAILIEVCFVDNKKDFELFNNLREEKIADSIVKGIVKYIKNKDKEEIIYKRDEKIKGLQKILNKYYEGNLIEDGIYGPKTKSALNRILLQKGSRGELIRWVQVRLIEFGYNLSWYGADGIFGENTKMALLNFQRNSKIETDGIIGPITWNKIIEKII